MDDQTILRAQWQVTERSWTKEEHRTIEDAARQAVRYAHWHDPKARNGRTFPEETGAAIISRAVQGDEVKWARMASAALIMSRFSYFREQCGRPRTLAEIEELRERHNAVVDT
jgi:succinate dehydrogenase/fumarate reductase flavoprotein subunit